jgi:hypothetical protein
MALNILRNFSQINRSRVVAFCSLTFTHPIIADLDSPENYNSNETVRNFAQIDRSRVVAFCSLTFTHPIIADLDSPENYNSNETVRNFAQINRSRVMAFLGEEDAHPYGQNYLAVKIEKSTSDVACSGYPRGRYS